MLERMNILNYLRNLFTGQAAKTINKSSVFVVYGRSDALRHSIFDFLRAIGLKPIEWNQALRMTGAPAPFVGDIVEAAMQHAQAMLIIFTGDDEARLKDEYLNLNDPSYEKIFTTQPRPNVIFESGLALGRYPERTIFVQVGILRPFSDIAGRHLIRLDNSVKARQELAQRLMLAGCVVDLSGTDWHNTGDFNASEK
jgi:predicted nucleotide-binding protein